MKANRLLRLLVRRGGPAPAWMADPERIDHVEVVDVASGEVVLFWDCTPRERARLVRALRTDMATLDHEQFLEAWSDASAPVGYS